MHNTLDKYESFIEATTKNISTYLSPYMEQLDKLYTWGDKAVEHNFVRENIAFDFSTLSSNFERTVQLKTSLQEMLKNTSSFGERYFIGEYFVVTWGGVRTNGDLKGLLASYDDLESPYGIKTLDKISSWSKYLSLKHEEAHIYDSRVAYAINAINFIYGNKDFFFQIPAGRSAKIGLLDIETLFMIEKIRANESFLASNALKHRQVASKTKKEFYIPESITYDIYLDLFHRIESEMYLAKEDVFKIEMLLFALAPENILESLIEHIRNQD